MGVIKDAMIAIASEPVSARCTSEVAPPSKNSKTGNEKKVAKTTLTLIPMNKDAIMVIGAAGFSRACLRILILRKRAIRHAVAMVRILAVSKIQGKIIATNPSSEGISCPEAMKNMAKAVLKITVITI